MSYRRIKATLADGRVYVGPIQGPGGYAPLSGVLKSQRLFADSGRSHLYEPQPGHVAMYPSDCAAGRGWPVLIPFEGTAFSEGGS